MMNRKRAPVPEVLKSLRKRLNHRDETIREQAFQEALALPPEMLLRLMQWDAGRARVYGRIHHALGGSCCLWVLICLVTAIGQFVYKTAFLLRDALLFLWMPLSFVAMGRIQARTRLCGVLSRVIMARDEARFVFPALMFYHYVETDMYTDIRQTLLRLMPLLTPADVEEWTSECTAASRQRMFWRSRGFDLWHDLEMLDCALETLARVGSAEDVVTVRSVARLTPEQIARKIRPHALADDRKEVYRAIRNSTILNPKQHGRIDPENNAVMQDERYRQWCLSRAREIYALANCSLAALLERGEQQQRAAGLLRASQATDTEAAKILLRPQIEHESQTPPEQLLRANTSKL